MIVHVEMETEIQVLFGARRYDMMVYRFQTKLVVSKSIFFDFPLRDMGKNQTRV